VDNRSLNVYNKFIKIKKEGAMCLCQIPERWKPIGFLILRAGIGSMFIYHGMGKFLAGPDVLAKVGSALSFLGIHSGHYFFGIMAALSEVGGGACLILGLFFLPASFFLFFTMCVASTMHLLNGDGLKVASHAVEAGILFLSLMFIGPGPLALDNIIRKHCPCKK